MNTLPYEILQQVASYLLPRYQCRLALTSRWCYQYLYNDLLRWHAHAASIEIPKYKCIQSDRGSRAIFSICQINKSIKMYNFSVYYGVGTTYRKCIFSVFNFTTGILTTMSPAIRTFPIRTDLLTYTFTTYYDLMNIFTCCYRYMHINYIKWHITLKNLPFGIPRNAMYIIRNELTLRDVHKLRCVNEHSHNIVSGYLGNFVQLIIPYHE